MVRAILFVLEGSVQGIYNVAGDGLLPWSEVAAICGKRTFPLPPFGLGLHRRRRSPGSGSTCRPSCSTCCATAAASTTAASSASASTTASPQPARSPTSSRRSASARMVGSAETAYQYERDVEQFFRHAPQWYDGDGRASERVGLTAGGVGGRGSAGAPLQARGGSAIPERQVVQRRPKAVTEQAPRSSPKASDEESVPVRGPVPGLGRQVVEAVGAGVGGEPLEAGAAAGADRPAAVR